MAGDWSTVTFVVQAVQNVQIDQPPSVILPRVAGEERGEGLNGAQRLNYLNGLNASKSYFCLDSQILKIHF
jgi:hypothetical protein